MALTKEDRFAAFKTELEGIVSPSIRGLAQECLLKVPEYFFVACPSSSTSKYHPEDEHGGNGTVLHTKRVCRLIPKFAEVYDIQDATDLLLCAGILHDSFKQGVSKTGHTQANHPFIAAESMADVYKAKGEELGVARDHAIKIYKAIRYHSGKWGKAKSKKGLADFSREEMVVHLADVAASQRFVRVGLV